MHALRQQIKSKLQNLTHEFRITASQIITNKILTNPVFTKSKNIACYVAIENEVDTWAIIKAIWLQKKNCYLPIFDPAKGTNLQFVLVTEHDRLTPSKYKIPEPINLEKNIINPQNLDLAIVPLIGFNSEFFRLGRGAGCYDHTFAFKQINPEAAPYLLGIGYELQHIEFEPKPWDVRMDEIVTEQGLSF